MITHSASIDIPAPPARVYDVMTDVDRWHEWTPSITKVKRLKDAPLSVGARVFIRQPKLPPAFWKVSVVEPGRGFSWVSTAPGFRATGRHYVEPAAGGSRATLAVDYDGPLAPFFSKMMKGITERYVALEAEGLKARSLDPAFRHS